MTHPLLSAPNIVSMIRLLMAPVLLWLAYIGHDTIFLLVLTFSVFTDLLDGFLARHLHQITPLGSVLDSWGDFAIYSTMAIGAWLLWPDIVADQWAACAAIVLSYTLPVLIGLAKFSAISSYHTWSVKIAVGVTIIGYLLLFSGVAQWPFHLAAVLCVAAAMEESAITLTLRHKTTDVRTLWQARRLASLQREAMRDLRR